MPPWFILQTLCLYLTGLCGHKILLNISPSLILDLKGEMLPRPLHMEEIGLGGSGDLEPIVPIGGRRNGRNRYVPPHTWNSIALVSNIGGQLLSNSVRGLHGCSR